MSTKERTDQKSSVIWRLGRSQSGNETHLVDFDTDSMLALGRGVPDKMLCGRVGDFEPAPDSQLTCDTCQKRMAQNAIEIEVSE